MLWLKKQRNFLESVKDAMNFAHQTAYLRKKLYKNNMIDDVSLLPDNNKDDRECVKFSRISSQEPILGIYIFECTTHKLLVPQLMSACHLTFLSWMKNGDFPPGRGLGWGDSLRCTQLHNSLFFCAEADIKWTK